MRVLHDVQLLPAFALILLRMVRTPVLARWRDVRVDWLNEPEGITNPSIVALSDGVLVAARTVPYRLSRLYRRGVAIPGAAKEHTVLLKVSAVDDWRGVGAHSTVALPAEELGRGFEDPRIFWWKQGVWVLWTASTPLVGGRHRNSMVMARLDGSHVARMVELPSPRGSMREKNWMPLVSGDRLYFLYDLARGEVYEYVEGVGLRQAAASSDARLFGQSGSSQFIPYESGWLGVSHHRVDRPYLLAWLPIAYYRHQLIELDAQFKVRQVSEPFFFAERGVEFCAGIARDEGDIVFSFGVDDARAALLRIPLTRVQELLRSGASRTEDAP